MNDTTAEQSAEPKSGIRGVIGLFLGSEVVLLPLHIPSCQLTANTSRAGVYNIPECAEEKRDENFFELISISVEQVCPLE